MAEVSWTSQAADDLEAIRLFIARDAPQVAAVFADRVLRATHQLEHFPRLGRTVPEFGMENIREIIVGTSRGPAGPPQRTLSVRPSASPTRYNGHGGQDARTGGGFQDRSEPGGP